MLRATKDIMLPTTITGSLPRPSWYTENLGTRSFLEAMVNNQFREQYVDAVRPLSARAGNGRPRHRHRRRRAFRLRRRRPELDQLSAAPHGRLRHSNPQPTPAGKGGLAFPPGHILHDYLEARVMPGIAGPVSRGDLQYAAMWKAAQRMTKKPVKFGTIGPELVAFAVQDKHYKSIKDRILAITDALERGTARARRRRLPGDPVRGAADPPAGGAQDRRRRDQSGVQRRGVQPHGEGPARQDRSVVPHLLGQSVAAAHVRGGAELQAGAGDAQQGRCRRDHLRIVQRRRHGPRSLRQDHHRQEDRHRRHRPSLAAGRAARRRSPTTSAARSSTFRPSGW